MSHSRAYTSWRGMIDRCTNPNMASWKDYGGRGITVCERWRTFEHFYADMGDPPGGMTLDRIDVDGNYEPSNCRWATTAVQSRNRRNNVFITDDGVTQTLHDWAREKGISAGTLSYRFHQGWRPPEIWRGRP